MPTNTARAITTAALSLLTTAGLAAHADRPHRDISDDARSSADPATIPPTQPAPRGSTLPFGSSPDYQVDLRRQVAGLAIADMNNDGHNDLVAVCYISSSFPPYEDWREMIFFNSPAGLETTPSWVSDNETHAGDLQVADINADGHNDLVVIRGGSVRADLVQVYFGSPTGPETTPSYSSNYARARLGHRGGPRRHRQRRRPRPRRHHAGHRPRPLQADTRLPQHRRRLRDHTLLPVRRGERLQRRRPRRSARLRRPPRARRRQVGQLPVRRLSERRRRARALAVHDRGDIRHRPRRRDRRRGRRRLPRGRLRWQPHDHLQAVHGALIPLYSSDPPFAGTQEIRLTDADGDADIDLAEVHFSDGRAHLYQNNGGALDTQPTWTFDAPQVGTAIQLGDLNNDGRADLAVGYSGDTCIRVFYAEAPDCPADLNGDTVLDLADIQLFIAAFNTTGPARRPRPPHGRLRPRRPPGVHRRVQRRLPVASTAPTRPIL
jgi:hypothetical protein